MSHLTRLTSLSLEVGKSVNPSWILVGSSHVVHSMSNVVRNWMDDISRCWLMRSDLTRWEIHVQSWWQVDKASDMHQIRSLKVPRGANVIVQGRLVEDTTPGLFVLEALTHWSCVCVCVVPSFSSKFIKLQCWIERLWSQASVPMQCLFSFVLRIVWYVEVGKLEAWKIDKSWPDKVSATSCYCKWHVLRLCACFLEFGRNRECRSIRSVRPGGVILRAQQTTGTIWLLISLYSWRLEYKSALLHLTLTELLSNCLASHNVSDFHKFPGFPAERLAQMFEIWANPWQASEATKDHSCPSEKAAFLCFWLKCLAKVTFSEG